MRFVVSLLLSFTSVWSETDHALEGVPLCGALTHVRARYPFDFGDRIVWQMHGFMGLADGLFVRAAHEAERLAFLQVDVRRMGAHSEFRGGRFKGIELGEEPLFG